MSCDTDRDRLSQLVSLLCDELINDDQFAELDEMLSADAEARRWYHVYVGIHRDLDQRTAEQLQQLVERRDDDSMADEYRKPGIAILLAIAASLLLMFVGYRMMPRSDTPQHYATITHAANVSWNPAGQAYSNGDTVSSGNLKIESGLLRLQYKQGVVLSLVGPADFQMLSSDHARLRRGQLAAYVPSGAEGFRVDTPSAGVVDLGTEFGMTVDREGETQLSVFDGQVELSSTSPDSKTTIVSSGHAYHIDTSGKSKRLDELAPYKEARDSLRGWQIVWEPFGPGSATGPFPGASGAGWQSPWTVEIQRGTANDRNTGILAKQPLNPGSESYFTLHALPQSDDSEIQACASRTFGPIDAFQTSRPFTIEMLLRIESPPDAMEQVRLFCGIDTTEGSRANIMQLVASRDSTGELSWKTSGKNLSSSGEDPRPDALVVKWWETVRCFVEIDPEEKLWRATIANSSESISIPLDNVGIVPASDTPLLLGLEVVGKSGEGVRFSIDGIRIQNRPHESSK